MKKLISILLMLMVLISCIALAEETDVTPEAPVTQSTDVPAEDESTAPETAPEAEDTEEASKIDWSNVSRMNKGLIVTAGGLGGVFLVLILFFLMIKVMGKLLK